MPFDRPLLETALRHYPPSLATILTADDRLLNLAIHQYETVTSTNTVLWDLLRDGAPSGTVVLARSQQSGRGQWGRVWSSPPGGIYLSWGWRVDLPVEQSSLFTVASGWGVAMALRDRGIPVMLKWPNDLVIEGRKLGGILVETRVAQQRLTNVVIGVGINGWNAVPETGVGLRSVLENQPEMRKQQPEMMQATKLLHSIEGVAALVLQGLAAGYGFWQQQGERALIPAYEALMAQKGDCVQVDDDVGTIVGISIKGELRVRLSPKMEPTLNRLDSSTLDSNTLNSSNTLRLNAQAAEICLSPGCISLGYRSERD